MFCKLNKNEIGRDTYLSSAMCQTNQLDLLIYSKYITKNLQKLPNQINFETKIE